MKYNNDYGVWCVVFVKFGDVAHIKFITYFILEMVNFVSSSKILFTINTSKIKSSHFKIFMIFLL